MAVTMLIAFFINAFIGCIVLLNFVDELIELEIENKITSNIFIQLIFWPKYLLLVMKRRKHIID